MACGSTELGGWMPHAQHVPDELWPALNKSWHERGTNKEPIFQKLLLALTFSEKDLTVDRLLRRTCFWNLGHIIHFWFLLNAEDLEHWNRQKWPLTHPPGRCDRDSKHSTSTAFIAFYCGWDIVACLMPTMHSHGQAITSWAHRGQTLIVVEGSELSLFNSTHRLQVDRHSIGNVPVHLQPLIS